MQLDFVHQCTSSESQSAAQTNGFPKVITFFHMLQYVTINNYIGELCCFHDSRYVLQTKWDHFTMPFGRCEFLVGRFKSSNYIQKGYLNKLPVQILIYVLKIGSAHVPSVTNLYWDETGRVAPMRVFITALELETLVNMNILYIDHRCISTRIGSPNRLAHVYTRVCTHSDAW